ncbi:MAG TPA: adenylate/guanylate cyclase domain-containing protein [Burkholderiales bacterium]|nr:adenylate/guanylate cyclase domain-containing protein [Burkholderiales bacterium]
MAHEAVNVKPVIDWLVAGSPPGPRPPEEVMLDLCRRPRGAGLPLYRVGVFVRTLHPNVLGRGFVWHETTDKVEIREAAYDFLRSDQYLQSPIRAIFTENSEIRRRLSDPRCPLDFPVLADFRNEGVTDFIGLPLPFVNGEVHVATFATRRAGGFTEEHVTALRQVAVPLARLTEIYGLMRKSRNILEAYLGRQAGEKVLEGHIRRGDGEDIHAVIWFCDLRDSTVLADSMSRADFLRLLNEFFECVLGPVLARGGEVLRFIGDAALAIFPVDGSEAEACERAVRAAQDARGCMAAGNASRERPLAFGIGLHLGHVLYGNIGTPTRIEFTVIGAAANEAARIEALTKTLGVPLILSAPVARHVPGCRSLGIHRLRGVGEPLELFTLQ